MSNKPLISIIMPCYGMGKYIGEALESVGKQTYTHWEVIAVDDCGPDDGTKEIIDSFASEYPEHRVELIRHQENKGVSAARNTAIEAANGEFLAFLDPDDLWKPSHLMDTMYVFDQKPEVGIVAGPVDVFRSEDCNNTKLWPIREWQVVNYPASLTCNNFIQPSAAIVRREILVGASWFSTEAELQHIEDYDLWIRLAELGVQLAIRDEATCLYRKHAGAATSDAEMMNRLSDALIMKHLTFFIRMQGQMHMANMNSIAETSDKLTGPLWGIFMRFNQWLRKLRNCFQH